MLTANTPSFSTPMKLPKSSRRSLCAFILLGISVISLPAHAVQDCAVILMHGKWGGPKSPYLKVLADKIAAICKVELREMPWSRSRNYDQTYENALRDMSQAVGHYRKEGYKKIFIAGQSFGANAAMAYQAYIGDADGIIALSPGHAPHYMYSSGLTQQAVTEAKRAVASGTPDARVSMTDLNQNQRKDIQIRADVLLSYFDPEGLGNMARTSAEFKRPAPFLWVIGTHDILYREGKPYAFDKVPKLALNKYLVVNATHASAPEVASDQVVEWIKDVLR